MAALIGRGWIICMKSLLAIWEQLRKDNHTTDQTQYKKKQTIHNTESVTSKNEISHRTTKYNLGDKAKTSIINEVESSSGTAEITNN